MITALIVIGITALILVSAVAGAIVIGAVVVAVESAIIRHARLKRDRADVRRLGTDLRLGGRL